TGADGDLARPDRGVSSGTDASGSAGSATKRAAWASPDGMAGQRTPGSVAGPWLQTEDECHLRRVSDATPEARRGHGDESPFGADRHSAASRSPVRLVELVEVSRRSSDGHPECDLIGNCVAPSGRTTGGSRMGSG